MRVVRQEDAFAFAERVTPYLLQYEAQNNIIFGILNSIQAGIYEKPYMAYVENDGEVVAVALRTPPHGVLLSLVTDDNAISCLIQSLKASYDSLPSVLGSQDTATQFAEAWPQSYRLKMQQGCYQIRRVTMPENVAGDFHRATVDDKDLVTDWQLAMGREAMSDTRPREDIAAIVERKLSTESPTEGYRLWYHDGTPVSMAAYTGPMPNGIRINCVYTPPEHRRHGYASAVTAMLSQELLDTGRKFCFLYTDMGNPTSNHIYQMIGYERISTQYFYEFEEQ